MIILLSNCAFCGHIINFISINSAYTVTEKDKVIKRVAAATNHLKIFNTVDFSGFSPDNSSRSENYTIARATANT
jgi:hypothetical protein